MGRIIIVALLLSLCSCSFVFTVPDSAFEEGKRVCEKNDGVMYWTVSTSDYIRVKCKNGVEKEYTFDRGDK